MNIEWQLVLIAAVLYLLAKGVRDVMSGINDLTAAVGNLETISAEVVTELQNASEGSDAQLESLASRVQTVASNLATAANVAPPPALPSQATPST